jgi:hypothetical protein
MKLENPKKNWKEKAKENIWTTYYECWAISTNITRIGHGAFFKQCLEPDIIFHCKNSQFF